MQQYRKLLSRNPDRPKILVVDDDEISATISQNALQDAYQVSCVRTGEEALDHCNTFPPDLILLDIEMPGMSGIEVCQQLKHNPQTNPIPIIFVTAHSGRDEEDACWQAGCTDFVNKPYSISTLRHRINAHVTAKLMADELKMQSSLDGLTGLRNRRYTDEYLDRQLRQSARSLDNLSIMMIDVDKFKNLNDQHGHLAGDDCLKHIAKVLQQNLARPLDCVGRFGGEEFLVVLPSTNLEGAKRIASALLLGVNEPVSLESVGSPIQLSVSIGVACCQHGNVSVKCLINEADQRLYDAKNNGRNQYQA